MATRKHRQAPQRRRPVATTFDTTATTTMRTTMRTTMTKMTPLERSPFEPNESNRMRMAARDGNEERRNCENISRNLGPRRSSAASVLIIASISIGLAIASLGLINCGTHLGSQTELAATVLKLWPNSDAKAATAAITGKVHLPAKRQAIEFDEQSVPSGGHRPDADGATSDELAPAAVTSEHGDATGGTRQDDPLPPPQSLTSAATEFSRHNSLQVQEEIRPSGNNSSSGSSSSKLHIVRLFGPESIQNGTQNVTLDCMFKFDPKLDQRLTIKWFFNDELEPIYQWIPELNKRVYSDKYEHMIDKSYQVTEDVDWMLQEYKSLLNEQQQAPTASQSSASNPPGDTSAYHAQTGGNNRAAQQQQQQQQQQQLINNRKLLANRLNRLAKLGSDHSRQLLKTLRSILYMDSDEASKYRALRLIGPTLNMSGRYTCSIASLDGDDLQSTRLTIYEPPTSFAFNVTRTPTGQTYNLTCQAGATYPRPSLALYRYRAGQPEQTALAGQQQPQQQQQQQHPSPPSEDLSARHAHRPRLAATQLKPEPLPGTQTQLTIGAGKQAAPMIVNRASQSSQSNSIVVNYGGGGGPLLTPDLETAATSDDNDIVAAVATHSGGRHANELTGLSSARYDDDDDDSGDEDGGRSGVATAAADNELASSGASQYRMSVGAYEISAWALVDEASLSTNLVTQFECVLTIEGTNYEQRQSLALQKGWHVNSQALVARSTLVGLMSVLASILCLCIALVSALLVFRLMRRHANNSTRVHQQTTATSTKTETARPPASRGSRSHARANKFATAGSLEQLGQTNRSCELDSSASQASSSPSSSTASTGASSTGGAIDEHGHQLRPSQNQQHQLVDQRTPAPAIMARQVHYSSFSSPNNAGAIGNHFRQISSGQSQTNYSQQLPKAMGAPRGQSDWQSDGIYRVPDAQQQHHQRLQQQQQQQQYLVGTRFVIGSGRQSPATWTDQVYQNNKFVADESGNFNDPTIGLATGGGGAASGSQATSGRGQLSGMLRAIPTSTSSAPAPLAATTRGATSGGPQATAAAIGGGGGGGGGGSSSRHTPATISVNGKQLYC